MLLVATSIGAVKRPSVNRAVDATSAFEKWVELALDKARHLSASAGLGVGMRVASRCRSRRHRDSPRALSRSCSEFGRGRQACIAADRGPLAVPDTRSTGSTVLESSCAEGVWPQSSPASRRSLRTLLLHRRPLPRPTVFMLPAMRSSSRMHRCFRDYCSRLAGLRLRSRIVAVCCQAGGPERLRHR